MLNTQRYAKCTHNGMLNTQWYVATLTLVTQQNQLESMTQMIFSLRHKTSLFELSNKFRSRNINSWILFSILSKVSLVQSFFLFASSSVAILECLTRCLTQLAHTSCCSDEFLVSQNTGRYDQDDSEDYLYVPMLFLFPLKK